MMIKDLINELQRMAAQDVKGDDMEVVLFDKGTERELRNNPDTEEWEFEVLRGDGQVVIEFFS